MLQALLDGSLSLAHPGLKAECPSCSQEVAAKCGKKVVWHWAHRSLKDCDSWSEGETLWHAAWKSRFPKRQTEVNVIYGGKKHRADAVSGCETVLEFQHSSISCDEIAERERFYGNMIWIVDCTAAFHDRRIGLEFVSPKEGQNFVRFRWKSRRRSFDDARCPVFLDLGFAFEDYGSPFYKPFAWWDDEEGGLRDGIKRPGELVWKRARHDLFLLEVKKQHPTGYGWGRLVTHEKFCESMGADGFLDYPAAQSVREIPPHWFDWDSYTYRGQFGMGQFFHLSEYRWCEPQVAHSRDIKEAV